MDVLGGILKSREEQQVCILDDFNGPPHTNRFSEIK
jgi:hypothetical protein